MAFIAFPGMGSISIDYAVAERFPRMAVAPMEGIASVEKLTMYRQYTLLSEGDGYKVKKITMNSGQKLSLQMHYQGREEKWDN